MRFPVRSRTPSDAPGLSAPARVDRRTSSLISRLRPGDIAVLDHIDLDRVTAQALVEAGAAAVVNAAPMTSGRYPNLGPEVLVDAGLPVVDRVGSEALSAVRDGAAVRLHDGELYLDDQLVAAGRQVDAEAVRDDMAEARTGMAAQLDSFTRNSLEFVRREEALLLEGEGLPTLRTRLSKRPVVVVTRSLDHDDELARVARFVRENDAVLIAVHRGVEAVTAARLRADVVVVDARGDDAEQPADKLLKAAKDVVVRVDPGSGGAAETFERRGLRPVFCQTGAAPEDLALLLAHHGGASVIVGVGLPATIEELLDRRHPGLASTYLTRLAVGEKLVDARAVPVLYSGRVRAWHLMVVLLAGLLALAVAVATTPVGQQWVHDAEPLFRSLLDDIQGLFS